MAIKCLCCEKLGWYLRGLSWELIRWALSDHSPESHQADLNGCTHPWKPLKRQGRKMTEAHKGSGGTPIQERSQPFSLLCRVEAERGPASTDCSASWERRFLSRRVQLMLTFRKAFFSRWFIKNGGMAGKRPMKHDFAERATQIVNIKPDQNGEIRTHAWRSHEDPGDHDLRDSLLSSFCWLP